MKRNLDRRVEQIVPILDRGVAREIDAILDSYRDDNASAWDMQPDGSYVRRTPSADEPAREVQQLLIDMAASGCPDAVESTVRSDHTPGEAVA